MLVRKLLGTYLGSPLAISAKQQLNAAKGDEIIVGFLPIFQYFNV